MLYSHEAMRADLDHIAQHAMHVRIVPERLQQVATQLEGALRDGQQLQTDPRDHPNETLQENDLDTLQYYLVGTAQHFCIWRRNPAGRVEAWDLEIDGHRYVGARGINAAHIRALRDGRDLLDPTFLASMTYEDVQDLYRDERTGDVTLQMLRQRLAKFNELGQVLSDVYRGKAATLFELAAGYLFRNDGRGLVQQLITQFPIAYFDWPFCKLAMLVGKLVSLRNLSPIPTTPSYRSLTEIRDPESMEVASDYYIPFFLIRVGIFDVSEELALRLRTQRLIERDSRMEHEYRASTMVAGRALAEQSGHPTSAVDEELWRMGYLRCRECRDGISDSELPCAYRALSRAYQGESRLMEARWPLVLTPYY